MSPALSDGSSDAALHRAFVSVRDGTRPVGAGVLLTDRLVLTCAHVVNSALGRDRFERPTPAQGQGIRLRLPHVAADRDLTGRVVTAMWRPPRSEPVAGAADTPPPAGMLPYHGDLAVLELDEPAPAGAEPAPFLTHRDRNEVVALWASGHTLPTLRAVPRVSAPPWVALDVVGGTVTEGFSGGPLWDRERQAVVGLVVAAHVAAPDGPPGRAGTVYAIGLPSVEAELPTLPPVSVPMSARGVQRLLAALERLLPEPAAVMECEQRLAARLGRQSAGQAADIHSLVALALGVRRGVPELLDAVHTRLTGSAAPAAGAGAFAAPGWMSGWDQLLRVARVVSPGEHLTLRQRRDLNGLLAQCRAAEPAALLRTVLPYADELPVVSGLAEATDALEGYPSHPDQPVPPLLQAVVRIGVAERGTGGAGADLSDDLDAWVEMTGPRLGVAAGAVDQFRADVRAESRRTGTARTGRTTAPPRVQVELLPVPPGHRFTYQIWVWTGDGRHEVVLTQDTEVSSQQVVEAVRHVLRTEVREHPEPALVEFFVAPAWLRLEVDTWEFPGGADDGGFFPGIARRVVLRSSGRTRETYAGWKRRTDALPSSRRLVLDQRSADPAVAQAILEVHSEAGIVVVSCERKHHGMVLRQCIQAGVHTVLWHREDHGERIAADLLALVEGVDHTGIPEAVRMERAKALADPESATHHGRRLSLLHDGPDHRPPPLAPDAWALTQP
ncbi:serine protease [Streptomyces sp. NPDC059396]|uniref:VMAP-C domain-containing protein n=1 Tax=Streptomyces sp. NPDC059396 TaxID=3346819 RepID=UPI0036A5FA08